LRKTIPRLKTYKKGHQECFYIDPCGIPWLLVSYFFSYENSIQFISLSKNPLQGVDHMDIEIVREYIYIYYSQSPGP